MQKSYFQVNFRIPTELKEQIEEAAKKNNRSITAELVSRLERTFQDDALSEEKLVHKEIVARVVEDFTDQLMQQLEKHRQLINKS